MDDDRFESLITRLEQQSRNQPQQYLLAALAVALLGFGVLGIAILFALAPAALFAGLAFAVVVSGGKAAILLLKLGKLLYILILPAWVMIKSSFQMLFARFPRPEGRELTREEAPRLFARIEELRQRMNGPRIHHVLLTDELNAAIVQHPRFGLFGWEENYLILGIQLLQVMSEEEALSVVAHEYGHLSGHHSRLGGFIYRFRSAWGRMQTLSEQWTDWGSRLIARLFQWYAPYFNAYTFVLARQNEYQADRTAAEIAGMQNAANALLRLSLTVQFKNEIFWPAIDRMVAEQPQPPDNRSHYWVKTIDEQLDEATRLRYLEIAREERTDHFDTHPSLNDRLQAIGAVTDETAVRKLLPPAQSAAQIWLDASLPAILQEFDHSWRDYAAEPWQQEHRKIAEWRERLIQLQVLESPSTDERWEEIKIIRELTPEADLLPKLNELLQQEPNHASARYMRGTTLLDRGDEAGIADLEHVMQQDPDAILPACETAWRFYLERDEARAEQYRQRWLERSDYEESVKNEFKSLPADATLAAHDLDEDTVEQIRRIVRTHAKQVRRAYLLRRILKSDSTQHDYVLAIETSRLTLGEKGPKIVKLLAKQGFPFKAFIVHLGTDPYKRFRKTIKKLGVPPILGK